MRAQSQLVLYIISVLLSRHYVINFMLLLGGCCGRNAGSHLDNSNENGQVTNGFNPKGNLITGSEDSSISGKGGADHVRSDTMETQRRSRSYRG